MKNENVTRFSISLAPSLLTLLGVASDVRDGALGFMRVSFVGIIFVFLYAMFQALMRGVGQTRVPLLITLGTVTLNFLLDPLFIFGWRWLPPWQCSSLRARAHWVLQPRCRSWSASVRERVPEC